MGPRDRPGFLNLTHDNHKVTSSPNNAATSTTTTPTSATFAPHDPHRPPPRMNAYMDLPSPRAGEVPPALSPLDAFAMQSRLLARRFEQDAEGRRISRLPPVMVAKEMGQRPGYFRSVSGESKMSDLMEGREEDGSWSPEGERELMGAEDRDRPKSYYPLMGRTSEVPDEAVPRMPTPYFDAAEEQESVDRSQRTSGYFGTVRAASPEQMESIGRVVNVQAPSPHGPSATNGGDPIASHPRTRTNDSQRSQRSMASDRGAGLAPPQSPRFPRSPRSFQSIRSVPPDSGDEEAGSQPLSSSRKFSGSSNMSRPQSPFSPWMQPVHRSPSMTSEYSMSGSQHQPPRNANGHFSNFSRPMSSSGSRPSFDSRTSIEQRPERPGPRRNPSGASSSTHHSSKPALSRSGSGDDMGGTQSFDGGETPNADRTPGPNSAPSYIYAKYALPRNRPANGDSTAFRDTWIQKQFEWDSRQQPRDPSSTQHTQHDRTQSDIDLPSHAVDPSSFPRQARDLVPAPSTIRSHSADTRNASHRSTPSVKTTSTSRTVKPIPLHQKSASADLTPEQHLDIGISAHDAGHTTKSTYHLRLAAHAGLPTAMLLYALACRHGWGMRPNQEEGVKWLRKAIDTSSLSVADADATLARASTIGDQPLGVAERKKRKAQYALAIYELGNSSMNGWGCPKDKQLALRCYEIAGEWGDADALAEAGRCYEEGVGCKKDARKAAGLLRRAEKEGVRLAGCSWIYKEKYMSGDEGEGGGGSEGKGRGSKHEKKGSTNPTSHAADSPLVDSSDRADRHDRDKDSSSKSRARSRSLWGRKREKDHKDAGGETHQPTSMGRDGREVWLANNQRSQMQMQMRGPSAPGGLSVAGGVGSPIVGTTVKEWGSAPGTPNPNASATSSANVTPGAKAAAVAAMGRS